MKLMKIYENRTLNNDKLNVYNWIIKNSSVFFIKNTIFSHKIVSSQNFKIILHRLNIISCDKKRIREKINDYIHTSALKNKNK